MTETSDNGLFVLGSCLAKIREINPDLATVVATWDKLPEAVKAGILAMVRAAGR